MLIDRSITLLLLLFLLTESLYSVKTKYIVADFGSGKEIYDEIERQLSGIPVGILGKSITFELRHFSFQIVVIIFIQ